MSDHIKTRIYMTGCFDMVHHGHCNAIRQARMLGDELVIGVINDVDIIKHKGPPVYSEEERLKIVKAIKWVDEVHPNVPYPPNINTLDVLYKCDFAAHGDDIAINAETGEDAFAPLIKAGRYRMFKRTEGVSTTDIVGRILTMTKTHHEPEDDLNNFNKAATEIGQGNDAVSQYTGCARFLATSSKILHFSSGKEPKSGDTIVYVSGTFDLLHAGHVDFLEKASKIGDFLIVGVHSDQVANKLKGGNYPIMNLHERMLTLLALRYVSEVVIGVPLACTADIMDHFKIDVVIHGNTLIRMEPNGDDPFAEPKRRNKFRIIDSGSTIITETIVNRILRRRLEFEERNRRKYKSECEMKAIMECEQN